MSTIASAYQGWLRRHAPRAVGWLTRGLYSGPNVDIHPTFVADAPPRCVVDVSARLSIGSGVEFRSGVELRAHGRGSIIIEDGVRIDRGVRILAANDATVRIMRGARIGLYSVLNGGDSITVGDAALVSGFVYLQTSMHVHASEAVAIRDQGYTHAPVVIEDGSWLGAHVTVMPGVTVGRGAVVGSNAVVTRSVPPRMTVAGVPAKPLRKEGLA